MQVSAINEHKLIHSDQIQKVSQPKPTFWGKYIDMYMYNYTYCGHQVIIVVGTLCT